MLHSLLTMCEATLNLDSAQESEITQALLDLNSVEVCFDLANKKLLEVEPNNWLWTDSLLNIPVIENLDIYLSTSFLM